MRIFISLIGIAFSFALLKYRERAGDLIGEAAWMQKVGGVYNVIVICGVIGFLWSLAYLTDTLGFLFTPVKFFFPGQQFAEPLEPGV